MPDTKSIAILMTCFNRRDTTLKALALLAVAMNNCARYQVYLVDDNCTDGTAEAVAEQFPDTRIIPGSGTLFWNQGMRLAWQTAIPDKSDFYLWLNDDVHLQPHSICRMLACHKTYDPNTIIVGRTVDPASGRTTYGGYKRSSGLSRLRWAHLADGETECDTMNGNCVLLPASAVADIGINSQHYSHAMGDVDYGLRARAAGYRLVQLSRPIAELERNRACAISRLTARNFRFVLTHPKGLPWREWLHLCRAHGGRLWPLNFLWRYLKITRLT